MTKEEVSRVLHTIRINYPNSYNSFNEEDSAELLNIWYSTLKEADTKQVYAAVVDYIKSGAVFAPNIGQILNIMGRKQIAMIDSQAMWQKLKNFMVSLNHDESDYEKYNALPEPIKGTYSLGEIWSLSQREPTANDTYERPKFNKAMEEYRNNQIQKAIQMKQYKQIEEKNND